MADDKQQRLRRMASEAKDPADRQWAKQRLAEDFGEIGDTDGWSSAPGGGYQRGYKPPVASNEPPPSFLGEVSTRLGELGQGAMALGSAIRHPIDTATNPAKRRQLLRGVDDAVTLGYGAKLADTVTRGINDPFAQHEYDPQVRDKGTLASTEEADQAAAPEYRTAGNLGAIALPGASTSIGRAGMKAAGSLPGATGRLLKSPGVLGTTGRALVGYGATAPATAALHAQAEGHRGEAAMGAAADPIGWGMAGAGGLAAGVVGNAPKRAAASETNALRDRVQYKQRARIFVPREGDIRAELDMAPDVRRTLKASDPGVAQEAVSSRLAQVADETLEPIYRGLRESGQNIIPGETVINQLKAAKAQFNEWAEAAPIAIVDDLIAKAEAMTAKTGGVDTDFLRKTATAYQKQGFANLPNFGAIPLSKEVKQAVGGAFRGAIADHVESIAGNTEQGKALRQVFEDANRRVSTWKAIEELADQMDTRAKGNAPATGDALVKTAQAANNPAWAAIKGAVSVLPKTADAIDRRVLGPVVESTPGQIAAPFARAMANTAPTVVGGVTNPLLRAAQEKRRRDEAARQTLMRGRQ